MAGTPEHVTVYKVETQDTGREDLPMQVIAYASGDPRNIETFYGDRATYSIKVTPIEVVDVTPEMVDERHRLHMRRKDLTAELQQVDLGLQGKQR